MALAATVGKAGVLCRPRKVDAVPRHARKQHILSASKTCRAERRVAARAASDVVGSPQGAPVAPTAEEIEHVPVDEIKAALLDSLYGTDRGLSASSELRAEINELISQLEAQNPTPSPTEALSKLDGEWKLVYTSNSELIALLALSKLPFVTIGDVTQRVDAATSTVTNKVAISVPLSRTAFSTTASFEARSPKRVQLKFEQGRIATPQLLADIDLPASLSVMGQTVDLGQVRSLLQPAAEQVKGIIEQVNDLMKNQPDLQLPIPDNERAQTWLLTTYLDDDTRLLRGDGGSVFILVKEVSFDMAGPAAVAAAPVEVAEPVEASPAAAVAATPAAADAEGGSSSSSA